MIVKSPLLALLTCCQTGDCGSTSEVVWLVPEVSVLAKLDPFVTMYCRPDVSGLSVSGYRTFSSSPFPRVYQTLEPAPSESANPVTFDSFQVASDPGAPGAEPAAAAGAARANPGTSAITPATISPASFFPSIVDPPG